MNVSGEAQSAVIPPKESSGRLTSLDAFRGLVIVTMTFVNYLAGIKNIPGWAKHFPEKTNGQWADGYTFVDIVFPAFLFIVGVAIPLALHKRMERGESKLILFRRMSIRAASLIFLGVLMVNKSSYAVESTVMSASLWSLLATFAVLLLWSDLPAVPERLRISIRVAAGCLLAFLLFIFRGKNSAGEIIWLQHSWWGILGMIGWAYLWCSALYLVVRGNSTALMGVLGLMLALYVGDRHGVLDWLGAAHNFINIGNVFGSTSADVMMGVLVGNWFVGEKANVLIASRLRFVFLFGAGLLACGYVIRPLHGINKVAATESYALVTGGISCLLFGIFYWLMDVKSFRSWANWVIPVGQNALLAYILPGILANLFRVLHWEKVLYPFDSGATGALNSAVLTGVVVLITWSATRAGVKLRM